MKQFYSLLLITFATILMFSSCDDKKNEMLQIQVDSLQTKINNAYKPGLGEFMLAIQTHHAKLWFAGINENWALADFEIGEIKETLDNAIKYLPERKETKDIPMIFPALDSLQSSVDKKDLAMFSRNYKTFTQTCNECHQAVHFAFNVIKTPTSEPVSYQEFKSGN